MAKDPFGELGAQPTPGDAVGQWHLGRVLGAGGMATVFLATGDDARIAAVKVLNPGRVQQEDIKRFGREVRALQRLDHPNVVAVYDAGVHQGYPWLAMEYVEGTDIDGLIAHWRESDPPDRFARAERLLRGLCAGLQHVHDQGLIHRDLKPSNVLVTKDGEAKLTDFGVVKGDDGSHQTQLTMAGRLVGTVAYMAPELITGETLDHRADLYGVGAILYLLLTLRRHIEADSVAGYLARHLTEVPKPPSELDPRVPHLLERLCLRLLSKDRGARPPSARAVLAALDRGEAGEHMPLRGREDLLGELGKRLANLSEGAGGVLLIHGPDGMGKSHVLSALLEQARGQGIAVHSALGWKQDPLPALLEAIHLPGEVSPEQAGKRIAAAIRGRPTVLAVEDLDRAPAATVQALAHLVRDEVAHSGEPLLLIATAVDLDGTLSPVTSGDGTSLMPDLVQPGPVDARAVVAMLKDRGVPGAVATVLGKRLHEEHLGSPGSIVEQLDALVAEGWLRAEADQLQPTRPSDAFRTGELPVPAQRAATLLLEMRAQDQDSKDVLEVLAVLDRAATPSLVSRCVGDEFAFKRATEELVRARLVRNIQVEGQELLSLAHPFSARVIRSVLSPEGLRLRHASVADALSARRRRSASLEVAHHLELAGQEAEAWPLFLQAARSAARAGRYTEVLDLCRRAERLEPRVSNALPPDEYAKLSRWAALLLGEALLARGEWRAALPPLEEAVRLARSAGAREEESRALGSLGRAHYRKGDFTAARPLLEQALSGYDPGAPERGPTLRALADVRLRAGDFDAAETYWLQGLELAREVGSRDGEARARRGLAHLRALQGRLDLASEQLQQADDLLAPEGDARVRAGVLARTIEIDTVAGRYALALRRAEQLIETLRKHDLSSRLAEAYAMLADVLRRMGEDDEALDAAQQAQVYAKAHGEGHWESKLRLARVFADLGRPEEVFGILPDIRTLPDDRIDDPAAQHTALRARALASSDVQSARDLGAWALVRPQPLLAFRGAAIAVDVALAMVEAHQVDAARQSAKRALKLLQFPATDGLRLEALVALHRASPDPRVLAAIGEITRRLAGGLSASALRRFTSRPIVQDALAAIR